MANPFFQFLHTHRNPSDRSLFHPAIGVTKEYGAAKKIVLPTPEPIHNTLSDLLMNRKSCRDFENTSVSLEDLSAILYWSLSELIFASANQTTTNDFKRRPHPSGGAKFPIETYVVTDAHKELNTALYHYRPDTHELEKVVDIQRQDVVSLKKSYVYEFVADIPVMIIFSYIMERNVPKYGSFGSKLALIEAGHIGQNVASVAQAKDVDSTMLAGGNFESMDSLFGFDSYNESTFYTVGLGKKENNIK